MRAPADKLLVTVAPTGAETTKADCPQPQTACYDDSVISYVDGVCRAGACNWSIQLDQCPAWCKAGACAAGP